MLLRAVYYMIVAAVHLHISLTYNCVSIILVYLFGRGSQSFTKKILSEDPNVTDVGNLEVLGTHTRALLATVA